ncbi:hypothetical protein M8727_004853, partial [Salmonella enterica subsp. enterica]|nr:hypothetical protein [Salmonella enterica subsp. enterica]
VIQSLNNAPVRQKAFSDWVGEMMTTRRPAAGQQSLGFVSDRVASALEKSGQAAPGVLAADGNTLKSGLTMAEYQALPGIIGRPAAVLRDNTGQQLLYVGTTGRDTGRTVVRVPLSGQMTVTGQPVHAETVPLTALQDGLRSGRYDLIEGKL